MAAVGGVIFLITSEVSIWCQRQGSDLRQMPYEDTALPLSYAGSVSVFYQIEAGKQ